MQLKRKAKLPTKHARSRLQKTEITIKLASLAQYNIDKIIGQFALIIQLKVNVTEARNLHKKSACHL